MTQIHDFELEVHRHSDGSIDFDHYRARATALRGAALRDAAALYVADRVLDRAMCGHGLCEMSQAAARAP